MFDSEFYCGNLQFNEFITASVPAPSTSYFKNNQLKVSSTDIETFPFFNMGISFVDLTDDELFPVTNWVLPAWALLALLPRWYYTFPIVKLFALSFAVLYVALILDTLVFHPIGTSIDDFKSLDGLLKLFSNKGALFGGWVHYIVFDLWTGMWITNDANTVRFPQLLLIPCLFFTLMVGPTGLLAYFLLKNLLGYTVIGKTD